MKNLSITDRYPEPAGRCPEQRSKATGGGKSPLDPMGANVPGYSADPCQTPGNSLVEGCDYAPLSRNAPDGKLAVPTPKAVKNCP